MEKEQKQKKTKKASFQIESLLKAIALSSLMNKKKGSSRKTG